MKHLSAATVLLLLLAASGCAVEPNAGPVDEPGDEPGDELAFPLTCASQAYDSTETWAKVAWRAEISSTEDEAVFQITGSNGMHIEASDFEDVEFTPFEVEGTGSIDPWEIIVTSEVGILALERPEEVSLGFWTGHVNFGAAEIDVSCWSAQFTPRFRYDTSSGECLDAEGEQGRQSLPVEFVRETGDGNCVDLGEQALEEGNYSYPVWDSFDLRGADLRSADMHFAEILDADFSGALLEGFDFGYVWLSGTIDAHTQLPEGCEPTEDDWFECVR